MIFAISNIIRKLCTCILLCFTSAFILSIETIALETKSIASTSLCGDSYILALTPQKISHLSWQSRSLLSTADDRQKKLPQVWNDTEILLNSNASHILLGSGETNNKLPSKIQKIELKWGESFETIRSNAELIINSLGLEKDIVDNWEERIRTLHQNAKNRKVKPKILYLSRSGSSAGLDTFVDAAIKYAGGVNIVKNTGWYKPDPEQLIKYDPDLIITSYFSSGYESVEAIAVRNKVIERFIHSHPVVEIEGSLWPCAGPGLIQASEKIAIAIDNLS
ncbi:hypothetical protein OAP69_02480 [Hellea sp.]|nr:hypothetical protein [Hellea sp.]